MAGFLEKQRQDNEARERQAAQERKVRKRQEAETVRKNNAERELRLQRHAQACRYLQESGIDRMTYQLVELFRREKKGMHRDDSRARAGHDLGQDHAKLSVLWDGEVLVGTTYKGFEIEGDPYGTIVIKGGFWGSTTLTISQWKDKPNVVESALEKAYNHPKKIFVPGPGADYLHA